MKIPWYATINWLGASLLVLILLCAATGTMWMIGGWALFMVFEIIDIMADWKKRPNDGYVVLEDDGGTTRLLDTLFVTSREARESAENEGGWNTSKGYRVASVRTVGRRLWVSG